MAVRTSRTLVLLAVLLVSMGASHSTPNFVVETADQQLCDRIAAAAEIYRRDLAVSWLGKSMPDWSAPCVMTVAAGANLGAGGATTFIFDRGEVYGWRMTIQGSPERLLDSVLPHEITHMIFASHFRQPVPRWADEGGATSVEHASEKDKHHKMLIQFLQTGRGIAFSQMFTMTEYPQDVMPLYAQGFSLAEYLIDAGGRRKFIAFLDEGMQGNDWNATVRRHYAMADLGVLQNTWLAWVRQGSPLQTPLRPAVESLAAARPWPAPNLILRLNPDRTPRSAASPAEAVAASPVVAANRWPTPPVTAVSAPAAPGPKMVVESSAGWHAPGQAPPIARATPEASLPVGRVSEQVAHPQPVVNGQ